MMNRRELVQAAADPAPFKPDTARLAHRVTDAKVPAVYFVPEVSAQAIMKVWRALKRPMPGKVALTTPDG